MMEEEYPSNSYKSKIQQKEQGSLYSDKKEIKPIKGEAKLIKKGKLRKLADIFVPGNINDVKTSIFKDIVVPEIQKTFLDIVTNGLYMLVYGKGAKPSQSAFKSKTSYGRYFNNSPSPQRESNRIDYGTVRFETYKDASEAIDSLNEIMSKYGVASIGDLYAIAGIDNDNYQLTEEYGWENIPEIKPVPYKDGWTLNLPKAKPIK